MLNEQRFKPLFLRLMQWATDSSSVPPHEEAQASSGSIIQRLHEAGRGAKQSESVRMLLRHSVFYAAVCKFGSTLKAIFVPYFGYILDDTALVLQKYSNGVPAAVGEAFPDLRTSTTKMAIRWFRTVCSSHLQQHFLAKPASLG